MIVLKYKLKNGKLFVTCSYAAVLLNDAGNSVGGIVAQQIDMLATEAVKLLVEQIEEHKNSKHTPVSEPVHKMITPVLIRRETTERDLLAEDN